MLNASVGWYQEKQAADVVASLKGDIAMRARVVRDGNEQDVKARELVPGDIVRHWFALRPEMLTFPDYH
jgi:H+-transporting ATPase